jgi:hypothetical protein
VKYTVIWDDRAIEELTALWLKAVDRRAVTTAAKRIDEWLGRDPLNVGESRASSIQRIAWADRLGVEFEVIEDDLRVIVQAAFGSV